jgi:hypothetical protein
MSLGNLAFPENSKSVKVPGTTRTQKCFLKPITGYSQD